MPVWLQILVGAGTALILFLQLVRLPWIGEIKKDVKQILDRENRTVSRLATMEQWQRDHERQDSERFGGITKSLELIESLVRRDRRSLRSSGEDS